MNSNILLAALCVAAVPAYADVTVTTQTSGKASFLNVGGEGIDQFKGKRQRTDSTMGGKTYSLIFDIDNMRFVDIKEKKRTATITPLAAIADELEQVGMGAMNATLTKTAQTKQIAGFPCTVHDLKIEMPYNLTGQPEQGMDIVMVLAGTVCLSTAVPGLADYQAFYKAAAESGFIFSNPVAAKSPTGAAQAKAYAALTKKMTEAGMTLESHITITSTGEDPVAQLMAKVAASDITMMVTKIETGDIPAERFDVPAGFKVKTEK